MPSVRLLELHIGQDGAEEHVGQQTADLLPSERHLGRLLSLEAGNRSRGKKVREFRSTISYEGNELSIVLILEH